VKLGGPDFDVPLRRRDNITFDVTAPDNLPVPFEQTDEQLRLFQSNLMPQIKLVYLGHTLLVDPIVLHYSIEPLIQTHQ